MLEIQFKEETSLLEGQANHIPFHWALVTQNDVSVLLISPLAALMRPQKPKESALRKWDMRSLCPQVLQNLGIHLPLPFLRVSEGQKGKRDTQEDSLCGG